MMSVTGSSNGLRSVTGLAARLAMACALMALAWGGLASQAQAAFGDDFGLIDVNVPGAQTVPGLAGETDSFWAGTCDTATAPAPPPNPSDPATPIPDGIGGIPPTILAPNFNPSLGTFRQTAVPSPVTPPHCLEWGAPSASLDQVNRWNRPSSWRLPAASRAGAHPDGSATFAYRKEPGTDSSPSGAIDNIYVDLPPGFVGDPTAVPKCTGKQFAAKPLACPPETQVGVMHLFIKAALFGGNNLGPLTQEALYPVYNLEPRQGNVAELGFGYASGERVVTVRIVGKARTNGDFGVTTFAGQIPAALPVINQAITLWGVPWAASNDLWRGPAGLDNDPTGCFQQAGTYQPYIPPSGFSPACQRSYDPSWGDTPDERVVRPFISNETDCNPAPVTTFMTDSYQNPGEFSAEHDPVVSDPDWKTYTSQVPAVTDCASLGFAPDISFEPTTRAADGASGLGVDLSIPQNDTPPVSPPAPGAGQGEIDQYVADATAYFRSDAGRATAHLKDTVVTLPEGMSVNLSAAPGLRACPDSVIGIRQEGSPPLFNNVDPFDGFGGDDCPDGSKLGTVSVETPLLDEPLAGEVILGEPKSTDPQSGEMFRLFLLLRDKERGLVAKIYGSTVADPATGRLTATFANNPELPFENLRLDLKGGQRGLLAMPQRCGDYGWSSTFDPWSEAGGGPSVQDTGGFATDSNCGLGFSPTLSAGTSPRGGGSHGTLGFRFSRSDGQQWLRGLTAELPQGLLASVRDVPLCTSAQIDAFNPADTAGEPCPAASRIGSVDAAAGSGDPFVLEKKGSIYLTEGYKGAPYGLAVSVPAEGGPFRDNLALSKVVVRQAVHVDPVDASVTAVSDPFPTIWHGLPLRVRDVAVTVDRPNFILNPSDCSQSEIKANLTSSEGATAAPANPFQATGCASLPFKPKLTLALTGKRQTTTGKHPGVNAQVTQTGVGEAGIQRAEVRLPKSLALDPDNAQALCEFADGTKPDLENHCPKGSIVGRARAVTPLLKEPLAGNVYFVKNVRIDPKTGNAIRTLPMIIVALRGEIAVNLKGESSTTKKEGKLVNTFATVPDAPVSQFNLNINGGRNGILAVTRTRRSKINLCASGRQTAEADIDGQNGRRHDLDIAMRKPCPTKKAKAKAKAKAKGKQRAAAKRKTARR